MEEGYKTQIKPEMLFGALKPVTFEREFQLKLVGDRTKLPRGPLTGGQACDYDADCFKSVHVKGEKVNMIITIYYYLLLLLLL